jgi:hypothetical protein
MWEFGEDGTVKVQLIGRVATLRRPKLGEFKMLRQTLEAAQGAASPRANELALRSQRLPQLGADARGDEEQQQHLLTELEWVRVETNEVRTLGEDIRVMWFTLVLQTLDSDGRVPHEDEFPPDILEGNWQPDLITYWLSGTHPSRPTVPGDESLQGNQ